MSLPRRPGTSFPPTPCWHRCGDRNTPASRRWFTFISAGCVRNWKRNRNTPTESSPCAVWGTSLSRRTGNLGGPDPGRVTQEGDPGGLSVQYPAPPLDLEPCSALIGHPALDGHCAHLCARDPGLADQPIRTVGQPVAVGGGNGRRPSGHLV